jgi:DNA repair protein RadC
MKYTDQHPTQQPAARLREIGSACLTNSELMAVAMYFNDVETTQAIADLFTEFGALRSIPRYRLLQIKGVGEKVADSVAAIGELARRELQMARQELPVINSPADAAAMIEYEMGCLDVEQLRVFLLDTRNRVHKIITLYTGSVNCSQVRIAEVLRDAIRGNFLSIIIAHNHPTGDPSPSPDDVALTRALVQAGKCMDISVLDHLVIGKNRWCSMKERGLGFS